jgi:uncharacterized protein (TIRG00374 family)
MVAILAFFLVLQYLVFPQLAGARKVVSLLSGVDPLLLALAMVLEGASLLAYAELTRSLLPHPRPTRHTILRINLTSLGVSHVVPGGNAVGAGVSADLLKDHGVRVADASFALGTQGIGSAAVLNLILWLALIASVPARGFSPAYATAALFGAFVLGAFAFLVLGLSRGGNWAANAVRRVAARLPYLDEEKAEKAVLRVAERLREVMRDRRLVAKAMGWAAANWLLDAASLWVALDAFGHRVDPLGLLVSYGVANVAASVPITPGGLGVLEAALAGSLVAFGTPRGIAVLGIAAWRLVNFWLPIPVGALAYLSLRVGGHRRRAVEELGTLAERAAEEADDPTSWARRLGLRRAR